MKFGNNVWTAPRTSWSSLPALFTNLWSTVSRKKKTY